TRPPVLLPYGGEVPGTRLLHVVEQAEHRRPRRVGSFDLGQQIAEEGGPHGVLGDALRVGNPPHPPAGPGRSFQMAQLVGIPRQGLDFLIVHRLLLSSTQVAPSGYSPASRATLALLLA